MTFTSEFFHPSVTTDIVVFSIIDAKLHVVLIERAAQPFEGQWALPGGFIRENEGLQDCARRELAEEAGVTLQHLEGLPFLELGAYGEIGRDPRGHVITIAFVTLIPADRTELIASSDAAKAQWFPIDRLPTLAFDHDKILKDAREKLADLVSTDISVHSKSIFSFLPEQFTLAQAQTVFETIKGEALDKRNFRKWITLNWELSDLGIKTTGGRNRPAALFSILN